MNYRTFTQARYNTTARFKAYADKVVTEKWQGVDVSNRPDMVTYELLMENFSINLQGNEHLPWYQQDIKPNLPWADNHFLERVSGVPLNPGIEWANWPWASSADKHRTDGMFNHTYMERLWPRHAGKMGNLKTFEDYVDKFKVGIEPHRGIREAYGDLHFLVSKLVREPHTRQAYIPLYFPEDTGADGRMPCTLGYQFIMRDKCLSIFYPLRSCDFIRHWADDCYLAVRLLLWVIEQCREQDYQFWKDVRPGTFAMHCTSLHVFANDYREMTR